MSKKIYYIMNIIVAGASAFFLVKMLLAADHFIIDGISSNLSWTLLAVICACIVYAIKALRLYLILMEKRISLSRFVRVYIKTTVVSLVLPLKMGELFRAYCYGVELQDFSDSILSVLVDRYFDSIPLVAVVLGYLVVGQGYMSTISAVLLLFVISITLLYLLVPSTFSYFNRFLMTKITTRKSLALLDAWEHVSQWHCYAAVLIHGRTPILLTVSCLAWGVEYVALWALSQVLKVPFSGQQFVNYLNSAFLGSVGGVSSAYLILGTILFTVLLVVVYGTASLKHRRRVQ